LVGFMVPWCALAEGKGDEPPAERSAVAWPERPTRLPEPSSEPRSEDTVVRMRTDANHAVRALEDGDGYRVWVLLVPELQAAIDARTFHALILDQQNDYGVPERFVLAVEGPVLDADGEEQYEFIYRGYLRRDGYASDRGFIVAGLIQVLTSPDLPVPTPTIIAVNLIPQGELSDEAIAAAGDEDAAEPPAEVLGMPTPSRIIAPEYPGRAIREGVNGSLVVRAELRADGTLHDIDFATGDRHLFFRLTRQGLREWKFDIPEGWLAGARSRTVYIQVNFHEAPCSDAPTPLRDDLLFNFTVCARQLGR
jgi:TonB-like protein